MVRLQKRLLLTVDGSKRSLQTVAYAGQEAALKGMKIVLFHVFNRVPEAYYDLEREPKSVKVVRQVRAWEAQQKANIRQFMDTARQMLLEAGHIEPAIEIKIHERQKGVARDIVAEAGCGYDALLIRRRGGSQLKHIIIGSVTQKLLQKIDALPLMIAGRKPVNKKILIGVDGSPGAFRAVQFVGDMIATQPEYQIRLVHVIRGIGAELESIMEDGFTDTGAIFDKSIRVLTDAGVDLGRISYKTIKGAKSRAGAIIEQAGIGWSTIVVGRRGLSDIGTFQMGRVSHKVVYAGREETVWIVN
jgi:nucleotide-binding universal stress UspA family protein